MGDYFIGEIRAFGFDYAPTGWALANGATMQVQQNQALFSLLGNVYGGDAKTTFQLPNLCGRTPLSQGQTPPGTAYKVGTAGGIEAITLTLTQTPPHTHTVNASTNTGTLAVPAENVIAANGGDSTNPPLKPNLFGAAGPLVPLYSATLASNSGGAAHSNMQPFAVVNYCIALAGLYPQRP